MEKEPTSFWADIKKYEETLVKDPRSYCFALLSELYRKVGLLDDAIGTAKRGTETHPEYIGGYMALGRALFDNGQKEEGKIALERVARATPENLLAQRLLSQVYMEEGNIAAAEQALQLLVTFSPDDIESRLSLEALKRAREPERKAENQYGEYEEYGPRDDLGVEPCQFLEENQGIGPVGLSGLNEEKTSYCLSDIDTTDKGRQTDGKLESDQLLTPTLAELYVNQGHYEHAIEVFEKLLEKEPGNRELMEGLDSARRHNLANHTATEDALAHASKIKLLEPASDLYNSDAKSRYNNVASGVTELSRGEEFIETMHRWLEAIGRFRECR
jgi:tetratricopeptide (TPR) repeat protein